MLLSGEVVLITGAGRGIGRAIALCFTREGASIALTGRDMDRRSWWPMKYELPEERRRPSPLT